MRVVLIALSAMLVLASCGQNPNMAVADREESAASAPADMGFAGGGDAAQRAMPPPAPTAPASEADGRAQGTQQPSGGANTPAPISYLAYAYQVGLELPGNRLIGVMDGHAAACRDAGPRLCQLISAGRDGDPDAYIRGSLSIRGEPRWLQQFMGGLESEARAAGGKIKTQNTSTEDLTRAIVDTEARLRAGRALRDRLQRLLESRPGRLSDLLEVERELARVQGEIDATESNLAVMRTRVSMSELTLSYESSARPVASDTFEPLGRALASFLSLIVQGLAAIIMLIAVLIPWALLAAGIAWLVLWVRKRRGGRLLPHRNAPQDHPPAANS